MVFHDELCAGHFPLALEITPPQRANGRILLRRASFLGEVVQTINVVQRPDRQASLDAAIELVAGGMDPVWHLATRGRTLAEIDADTERGIAGGVRHALVVRGDHESAGAPDVVTMKAVVAHLKERFAGLHIGATLNQYQLENPRTMGNLLGKIDAGACYVQTQPVFDVAPFLESVDRLKQARPEVPVVPMVMPLTSLASAEAIRSRLGIPLPGGLLSVLEAEDTDGAWEYFGDVMAELRESPLVAGAALMTFEMDPGPEVAAAVGRALYR